MLPFPPAHRHVIKGLFTIVPFMLYIMSNYQAKIIGRAREQKTKFEKAKKISVPYSNMGGMVE